MTFERVKMNVYAVISEFNPFHNGHAYLCRAVKERDSEAAVMAVMSGDFCQRGEVAIIDKYARAEAAVRCGADLVLELPAPWCFSGAEFFALGGVSVAAGTGVCKGIAFGSESGDADELRLTAERLTSELFIDECRRLRSLDKRANTAEIRAEAYASLFGATQLFSGSNNLLALEYIRAAGKIGADLDFVTVKRVGEAFNSDDLVGICSASAIRSAANRGLREFSNFMPEAAEMILRQELSEGRIFNMSQLEKAVFATFITEAPETLEKFMEVDEGIAYRLCDAAVNSGNIDEMIDNAKNRRFSASRIRRAILSCLLKVHMSDAQRPPRFTCVLAANETGREVLSLMRKNADIEVLSKLSDAKRLTGEAAKQYALHRRAERVAELCCLGEPKKRGAVMV